MGFSWSCSALLLLLTLLLWLEGSSSVLGYDLRERDALCDADDCFVVYFERKIFLDSWRTCKDKGGDLATIKRKEDANAIAMLFSTLDLRQSRTTVQVWIGLQRQPRQCSTTHPLRGFSWTTGDQDTEYTNWDRVDSAGMCLVPRCVVMGYSTQEQSDNFKWLDGPCSVPVDGYICRYSYKGMCAALWSEGAGNALYTTPFNLVSSLLTHVPFGSVANMPCPAGTTEDQSQVLCMQMEDGSVGWSRDPPLCSDPSVSHSLCVHDNGRCEHFCRAAGGLLFCECADGYSLRADGRTCEPTDACQGYPCDFECLPLLDGYRCACPDGYMLAPDEHACLDVNECLQNPCEQVCKNAPGTFECQCWDGYLPDDGGGCEDIDECKKSPCEQSCENTLGSYVCHCHLGFSIDLEDHGHCQDDDECQIAGICEQMCANYEGGFECYCEEGYKLMSDHYTCQKVAVTQLFPWATHQPGPEWDAVEYVWNPEPGNTGWPTEEDQPLDWFTETPSSLDSDVVWVTSAPQDDRSLLDIALTPLTRETKRADDDSSEWDLRSQSGVVSTISHDTTLPSAGSRTTSDWNKEEDAFTALPLLSTSTVSEGALNSWSGLVTSPQRPERSGVTYNVPTDSDLQRQAEEKHIQKNSSQGESDRKKSYMEVSPNSDVPIQFTTSQPPIGGNVGPGRNLDSVQTDREQKQNSTMLLVGLLVPICIFLVVMVALGIIYCTRCAVRPRNKTITDCYHWISGAHDKQGPPDPSVGAKTSV